MQRRNTKCLSNLSLKPSFAKDNKLKNFFQLSSVIIFRDFFSNDSVLQFGSWVAKFKYGICRNKLLGLCFVNNYQTINMRTFFSDLTQLLKLRENHQFELSRLRIFYLKWRLWFRFIWHLHQNNWNISENLYIPRWNIGIREHLRKIDK